MDVQFLFFFFYWDGRKWELQLPSTHHHQLLPLYLPCARLPLRSIYWYRSSSRAKSGGRWKTKRLNNPTLWEASLFPCIEKWEGKNGVTGRRRRCCAVFGTPAVKRAPHCRNEYLKTVTSNHNQMCRCYVRYRAMIFWYAVHHCWLLFVGKMFLLWYDCTKTKTLHVTFCYVPFRNIEQQHFFFPPDYFFFLLQLKKV